MLWVASACPTTSIESGAMFESEAQDVARSISANVLDPSRARLDPRIMRIPYCSMVFLLMSACASSLPPRSGPPRSEPPPVATEETFERARPLEAPPAAVSIIDAPGLNVEDLTAHVRDAIAFTSGLDVVDQLSVRAELAACTEAPCPDRVAKRYEAAAFIVAGSVSRVGSTFLATVHIQRGTQEVLRVSARGTDALQVAERAGHEAGVRLREQILGSTSTGR